MPRELINANITHVSYVDKGANKKQFFLTKSENEPTFQKEVKLFINKDEEEQRLVYGVVYEPDVEDSHGDFMTAEEIEKAAHAFLKDARNIDKQHNFESGYGEVVESYIAPTDFVIGEHEIVKGSWVLVTKASEEIWKEIKEGKITGYSMAGTAETVEKEANKQKEQEPNHADEAEFKGFFNLLKNFFTKSDLRERYIANQRNRNLWALWDGLENSFYEAVWENETPDIADFDKLQSAVNDFADLLDEIKDNEDFEKALENKPETIGKGEGSMKKEDIEKLLDEKLAPINERLDEFEKEDGQDDDSSEDNELLDQLSKALDNKLEPINQRLDAIEKARGISKQVDTDIDSNSTSDNNVQKGYMRLFG